MNADKPNAYRRSSAFISVHQRPITVLSHPHDRSPLRMYPRRPAAAFGQVDLHFDTTWDLTLDQFVIARHPAGVHAVVVALHTEVTRGEEVQDHPQIPGRPVGHGADVPVFALAARHHHVLGDL